MGSFCSCHCRCGKRAAKKIVLLLVGLDNAGKTTVLKGLSGESTDHIIPSVGFSNIALEYKGHNIQIYDLGGGRNIRGIWNKYFTDVHGVIFVVDASAVERVEECRDELERLLQHEKLAGKPMLVLANKQDLPGALDELDLVERLGLEALVNRQKCPTSVETSAAVLSPDPAVQNGFKWLLESILRDFEILDRRVQSDMAQQQAEEQQLQQERRNRVQKLREQRESSNGHAQHDQDLLNEEQDFNRNPFRPISELTTEDRATPGTKMILVQQSPTKQAEEEKGEKIITSLDSVKSIESLSFTSRTGSDNQLVRDDSAERNKKKGLFSLRSNKTAPMPDSSPVRKPTLPPLKQPAAVAVVPAEAVPWIKPVLSASAREHRNSSGQDGAWGLEQALETVHPLHDLSHGLISQNVRLTKLSRPSLDNGH